MYKMTNGQSNNLADIKARTIDRECGPFNDEVRKFCTNDAKKYNDAAPAVGPDYPREKKKGLFCTFQQARQRILLRFCDRLPRAS